MFQLSKKVIPIAIVAVILVGVWVGSAIYIGENEWEFHHSKYNLSREENDIFENTSRKVLSIDSGATVSITFGNSWSLSEAHALFEIMKGSSEYKNSAFTLNWGVQGDTLNIAITSDTSDVVKYLQKEIVTTSGSISHEKWFGIEFLVWGTENRREQAEGKNSKKGKREGRDNE